MKRKKDGEVTQYGYKGKIGEMIIEFDTEREYDEMFEDYENSFNWKDLDVKSLDMPALRTKMEVLYTYAFGMGDTQRVDYITDIMYNMVVEQQQMLERFVRELIKAEERVKD